MTDSSASNQTPTQLTHASSAPLNDAPPVPAQPTASDATLAIETPPEQQTEANPANAGVVETAPPEDVSKTGDAPAASGGAITADQARVVLRRVKDPELNLNIVDLGLVYDVAVEGSVVRIDMSLTSPGCPSGPEIMGEAEQQLRTIPGVTDVVVNLIWSPPWTPERIEPRVRAYMGF